MRWMRVDWEPRYNIAPTQNVGIIREDRAQPFVRSRWCAEA
jgi:putative SOS response-associated peptidase YedK